jgi:hypothetical protein
MVALLEFAQLSQLRADLLNWDKREKAGSVVCHGWWAGLDFRSLSDKRRRPTCLILEDLNQNGHWILQRQASVLRDGSAVADKEMLIPENHVSDTEATNTESRNAGIKLGNFGKPITLRDVFLSGVTAEAALPGASVKVWTRASMTSDQAVFHRVAPNLLSVLRHHVATAGEHPALDRASMILLVIKTSGFGELWVDTAAVATEARFKRNLPALSVVMESDIADITGMWFPSTDISAQDQIIVIFREGFRFGLFFDFNPGGCLNIENAKRDLGTMFRKLRYADLYAVLANEITLTRVIAAGWFPFIEILGGEFKALSDACEAGFSPVSAETSLINNFSHDRLDQMFERWMTKQHLKEKEAILRPGMEAYKRGEWVTCVKIILTEIEGVIAEAYFAATANRTRKIATLLDFTVDAAISRAGGKDTLFFPIEFAEYLRKYTYADSDIQSASRHAVGHGRAKSEDYSPVRALQALLTLDQFAFYS